MKVLIALAALLLIASPVLAANPQVNGQCSISPNPVAVGGNYFVSASGLPSSSAAGLSTGTDRGLKDIYLVVTDPNGIQTSRLLGPTSDGTFNISETAQFAGSWTYSFQGPEKHSNTQIYAVCSVNVV